MPLTQNVGATVFGPSLNHKSEDLWVKGTCLDSTLLHTLPVWPCTSPFPSLKSRSMLGQCKLPLEGVCEASQHTDNCDHDNGWPAERAQVHSAHVIFVFIPRASNKQCLHPVFKGLSDSTLESTCSPSWMRSSVSGYWPESPNRVGLAFIKWIPEMLDTCQPFLPCGSRFDLLSHPERKSTERISVRTWFCDVEWQFLWQGQVPVRICMRGSRAL